MARLAAFAVCVTLVGGMACSQGSSAGIEPTGSYALSFVPPDASTGIRTASLRVYDQGVELTLAFVQSVEEALRVSTWPGGATVPSALSSVIVPGGGQTDDGAQLAPTYGQIDVALGEGVDPSGWYALSIAALPPPARWMNPSGLFRLPDGAQGIRISPSHAPVVASVVSCKKTEDVVAVYVRFSEPVSRTSGAVTLDYDATACRVGDDGVSEIQCICTGVSASASFSIRVADAVVSASGAAMPAGTIHSAEMQASTSVDGCVVYKADVGLQ